jgi:FAD/FMN-containing dehydrogenase
MTAECEMLLSVGFVPYKAPRWAARRMLQDADPGFVSLLRRVKGLLDPGRIMNPGRWDLD